MSKDFSRIITLLRKERGMTQKEAAAHLVRRIEQMISLGE